MADPQPEFVGRYQSLFADSWTGESSINDVRFILVDSETTGLNPEKDRLITIGAVAVQHGEIVLSDTFEALIKVEYNTSSVTVHGVTRDDSMQGLDEAEALEQFLDYLGNGVIVGHHIGHDVATFNAGYRRNFGFELRNLYLDTMDLTLHLEKDGAFPNRDQIRSFTLDALCDLFGVIPHDRHTAPGDAFLTAQVFLRLLRMAKRFGRTKLKDISQAFVPDENNSA